MSRGEDSRNHPRRRVGRNNPSISDYSHWNEEAAIMKAQEDKYADYYDEPRHHDEYEDDDY